MCGIVGLINFSGRPTEADLLLRMNNKLHHRGPDDEGYVLICQHTGQYRGFSGHDSPQAVRAIYPQISGLREVILWNIGLAHRRYSIIDLTPGGHQPFFDASSMCCVIFNGEIYNYIEVREELRKMGHVFRTASDTEVIVEAYKAWGVDSFSHLNGMWAIVLYDFNRGILIASRDRLGKKPLYWTKKRRISLQV